jgi:ABC-type Mn2+/Zn2+ transport system ATPase subunit
MDEPSTGLDPASRKCLWNVIKLAKRDRAIILTSNLTHFHGFSSTIFYLLVYALDILACFIFDAITARWRSLSLSV